MKNIFLTLVALILLPFLAARADACSCAASETVCDAYKNASAIFVGTVLSDSQVTTQGEGTTFEGVKKNFTYLEKVFRFSVEESLKGVESAELDIQTASESTACGVEFRHGEKYLVYAYFNPK